ncbi:uncharacterized protein AMSG_01967 [Thecamonas trahens ATCC 50062]|uniref:EF-hand domain-containing protein n=1 Tax=Thecamonas trahens ATCC 50062 TaxID=461836 RepID=A0A0L0DTW7_THETB|nr:hypothetical protein AMSG_01967 [Thecamonas trahens ATCC 50062]KNC55700.1 hypothetical protein AMSG_01967 [Thecamonas trahens ATCC 50062]|eukprot:XP_013761464.1 hypothetical protein AMSG_01967 [Thecamonas trahens ATCC 50062]
MSKRRTKRKSSFGIASEDTLTSDTIAEYKELFEYIDGEGKGYITKSDLSNQLMSNGIRKTAKEIDDLWKSAGGGSQCDFNSFVMMIDAKNSTLVPSATLKEAIDTIDRNELGFGADPSGRILADRLEEMLLELGDKLSGEEVDAFMSSLKIDGRGYTETEAMLNLLLNN